MNVTDTIEYWLCSIKVIQIWLSYLHFYLWNFKWILFEVERGRESLLRDWEQVTDL